MRKARLAASRCWIVAGAMALWTQPGLAQLDAIAPALGTAPPRQFADAALQYQVPMFPLSPDSDPVFSPRLHGELDRSMRSVPLNRHVSPAPKSRNSSDLCSLEFLPDGLLYRSYLAGPLESRLGTSWLSNSDGPNYWDTTLGGRVGLLRWGASSPRVSEGWQLDVEGAAFPRLNLDDESDLDGTDFRVGLPLTWRRGPWQAKTAFYHLSSHAGDEFIERDPAFQRINFSRNAIVIGFGYFATPNLRLYGEADYGVSTDGGADPWWFQFGFDLAPSQPTSQHGAPFVAANGLLREEVDFGGTFTFTTGWAWRADRSGHLLRVGLQYSGGHTSQLEFHEENEQLIGFGIWYDY